MRARYHETRVPGVPLAGCVLHPGRAINCEAVLSGKGERDQGVAETNGEGEATRRGTFYCYRFTQHAYLTPALSASRPHPPNPTRECIHGRA